jgi:hypothetical protein
MTDEYDNSKMAALLARMAELEAEHAHSLSNLSPEQREAVIAEIMEAAGVAKLEVLRTGQTDIELDAALKSKAKIQIEVKLHKYARVSMSRASDSGKPRRIVHPPGSRLGHVLRILLTQRAYEKLVQPVIADAQHEYLKAVAAGRHRHAQWIAVRLYLIIWPGWMYGLFASFIRRIMGAGTGG